jgi:hypothetical protein
LNRLLHYFLDLCLLRARPQDLPASEPLFGLVAANYLLVGLILTVGPFGGVGRALAAGVVDLGLLLLFLRAMLSLRGHPARWLQTATALLGSLTLLSALGIPLDALLGGTEATSTRAETVAVVQLLLLIWTQVVTGHVLRHALQVSLGMGVMLSVTYTLVATAVIINLFPTSV